MQDERLPLTVWLTLAVPVGAAACRKAIAGLMPAPYGAAYSRPLCS